MSEAGSKQYPLKTARTFIHSLWSRVLWLDFVDSLARWKSEGKVAVWLRVPITMSRCAAAAAGRGFTFHHAQERHAVLSLWMGAGESKLPGFATHQIGVAGREIPSALPDNVQQRAEWELNACPNSMSEHVLSTWQGKKIPLFWFYLAKPNRGMLTSLVCLEWNHSTGPRGRI